MITNRLFRVKNANRLINKMLSSSVSTLTGQSFDKRIKLDKINKVKAVVFDLDGTLIYPMTAHLRKMREVLKVPQGTDILTHVWSLPTEEQAEAERIILEIEEDSKKQMKLHPGYENLMEYLTANEIPKSILTRNNLNTVNAFLTKSSYEFTEILTRDFKPPKPSPDPLLHICKQLNLSPSEVMMVGDHLDDLKCGISAGCITVLLNDLVNGDFKDHSNYTIDKLDYLIDILNYHNNQAEY